MDLELFVAHLPFFSGPVYTLPVACLKTARSPSAVLAVAILAC